MDWVLQIFFLIFQKCFKFLVILFVVLMIGFAWQHISAQMAEIDKVEKLKTLAKKEALIEAQLENVRRDLNDLEANKPSWFHPIRRWGHNKLIKSKKDLQKK